MIDEPKTQHQTALPEAFRHPDARRQLEQIEVIADWMDRKYLDPILGMVFPGAGDTLCSLVGLYSVVVAVRVGVHPVVVARMILNLALDALIGSVPVLGWIGDFFYRAHLQNLQLLKTRADLEDARPLDWVLVMGAVMLLLFALLLPMLLLALAGYWLLTRL